MLTCSGCKVGMGVIKIGKVKIRPYSVTSNKQVEYVESDLMNPFRPKIFVSFCCTYISKALVFLKILLHDLALFLIM